jgi:hypothetical protein
MADDPDSYQRHRTLGAFAGPARTAKARMGQEDARLEDEQIAENNALVSGLVAFWTLILRSPVAILVFAAGAFGLIWALTGSLMLDLAAVVLFVGVFLFMRHRKRRKSAFSSKGHSDPSEHLDGR